MEQILKKRVSDMTLLEVMEATNRIKESEKQTLTVEEFAKWNNIEVDRVRRLLRSKYYPSELIVGGYEGRTGNNKCVLFVTSAVVRWINGIDVTKSSQSEFADKVEKLCKYYHDANKVGYAGVLEELECKCFVENVRFEYIKRILGIN